MAVNKHRDVAAEAMAPAELRDEIDLVNIEIRGLDDQIAKYQKTIGQNTVRLQELEKKKQPVMTEVKMMAILTLIGFVIGVILFFVTGR